MQNLMWFIVKLLTIHIVSGQIDIFNLTNIQSMLFGERNIYQAATPACNRRINQQRVTLQSPTTLPSNCNYVITPHSRNVCQVRIDFEIFQMKQPQLDQLQQQLQCTNVLRLVTKRQTQQQQDEHFRLCGENSGQHLYLPFNGKQSNEEINLEFILPEPWAQTAWRLVVTQLECPTAGAAARTTQEMLQPFLNILNPKTTVRNDFQHLLAPLGCHQYYTKRLGEIKSFNFNAAQRNLYLPNLHYVICIASESAQSYIRYKVNKFEMSQQNPNALGLNEDCHATVSTVGRREDYLLIAQAEIQNSLLIPTYFCGAALHENMEIIARAPFQMIFNSDDVSTLEEIGFSIAYQV